MTIHRNLAPPLLLVLGLFAPPSEAAPPRPRSGVTTSAADRAPPPRKTIILSPEVQQRLSRATVARKPVRYVPLMKDEVRTQVSAQKRPVRASKKGKPKRVSNTELTNELNALERKLSSQGYTLRDNKTVVYHEHHPDRAKLDQQVARVRDVVRVKPKRAPMTGPQLRSKVRGSAKPPTRIPMGPAANVNGFWIPRAPTAAASSDFGWTPSMGEAEVGSAYLDTQANFSGSIGGQHPGLQGSIVVRAGTYVLDQRVDVLRLDTTLTATLDGTYEADVTATILGGWETPLYHEKGTHPISIGDSLELFNYPMKYGTTMPIVGFPVTFELTVSPTVQVGFDVALNDAAIFGSVGPEIRVEATLEAYINLWLVEAGAGGSVVMIEAKPELMGAAYFGEIDGRTVVETYLSGRVQLQFLKGRIYAFLEVGFWPLLARFEHELMHYDGWSWDHSVFEWDHSTP